MWNSGFLSKVKTVLCLLSIKCWDNTEREKKNITLNVFKTGPLISIYRCYNLLSAYYTVYTYIMLNIFRLVRPELLVYMRDCLFIVS